MRDVVQDLALEALADHLGRHLARTEAGQPRRLAVARRDARDLGVHDVGRDLDREVPACFVDVDEFGFHAMWESMIDCANAMPVDRLQLAQGTLR